MCRPYSAVFWVPWGRKKGRLKSHIAYDDDYTGLADSLEEGERLTRLTGDKHILLMKNHGVRVVGDNIAQAYRQRYRLEPVRRGQVLAMGAGNGCRQAVVSAQR